MNLGLGLSLSTARAAGGGGASYSAEATALFAQMAVQPDATRKGLINTLIVDLKAANIWTKLDWFSILAAQTQQQGLLNWKTPTKAMTVTGSVTFTTDLGFNLTTSANTNYIEIPEAFNAAGNVYALNDAHFSCYLNAFTIKTYQGVMSIAAADYNGGLGNPNGPSEFFAGVNTPTRTSTTGVDNTAANFKGMWTAVRTGASAQQLYKSGAAVNGANSWTNTLASTAVPTQNPRLFYGDGSTAFVPADTGTRVAARTSGSSLTSGEASTLATLITTHLTAIGAN